MVLCDGSTGPEDLRVGVAAEHVECARRCDVHALCRGQDFPKCDVAPEV